MSKTLKPQIRFKGYDDEWQQAKVREVFNLGNGYTPSKAVAAYWTNGTIPWFRMEDIRENGRVLADAIQHVTPSAVKSSGLFPAGSIIVSTTATIGEHALLIADSLANQQFTVFQTVNRWSWLKANYLLYRFYGLGDWCRRNVNAGGLAAVNISDLQKYDIDYPKEETERDSIAEYFSNLDTQIKEAEREVDRLEKMKIASLQKMFPRPGATAPEIRFAGFSEPWKNKRLGEIMNVGSVKRIHQEDWRDTGVRFLRARDIVAELKGEKIDDQLYIDYKLYEEFSAISGKVEVGDLLVTGVGTIGIPYLVKDTEPIYFKDGNIIWFKNSNYLDGNFFFYSFIAAPIQDFILMSSTVGTVGTYTIESGKSTPITIPSLAEQRAIGEYFRNLDELIAAKRKSIVKLRNIKKACLSKMFVNDTKL
ncbi:restriction endonuclease subunit S [Bacteroides caecimuris]|uniref:restriction endonuclease subunit S n=1 Tax=Bacteroides caecimuris TaxID=1796613 RepID=UPI0026ED486F|nr:restriction endonuclease subunit S [Bacteroides caecimuris]